MVADLAQGSRSVAIACGVAAAISTGFNAPIAGLMFAHEVILRHHSLQAFAPTTVASASGFVVANVLFERPPLFLITFEGVGHAYEFALFALLGVACALLAVVFMKGVIGSARLAMASGIHPVLRPAVAGLIVGVVALKLPDVLGVGSELLRFATIEGAFSNLELTSLVVAKLLLTALCLGFGFAGGIFSPSLLVGILFGALCWNLLGAAGIANSGIAVYAISSMVALASSVIGAPLTAILIVFELTRNYELTFAAMVTVVFANLIVFRLAGRSLFDIQLAACGVDLSNGRDRAQMQSARLTEFALSDAVIVGPDELSSVAYARLISEKRAEAVVVDSLRRYVGLLRLQDLDINASCSVKEVLISDSLVLFEDSSLWDAMNDMKGFIGESIPVLSRNDRGFLGALSARALSSRPICRQYIDHGRRKAMRCSECFLCLVILASTSSHANDTGQSLVVGTWGGSYQAAQRAFTGEKPRRINDLSDLERFPGKRALQRSPAALFEWAMPVAASSGDTATALSFLRFALHPETLAQMATQIPYGPLRHSAFGYIGLHPDSAMVMSDHLPTADHHLANALQRDTRWYARTALLRQAYFSDWMQGQGASAD